MSDPTVSLHVAQFSQKRCNVAPFLSIALWQDSCNIISFRFFWHILFADMHESYYCESFFELALCASPAGFVHSHVVATRSFCLHSNGLYAVTKFKRSSWFYKFLTMFLRSLIRIRHSACTLLTVFWAPFAIIYNYRVFRDQQLAGDSQLPMVLFSAYSLVLYSSVLLLFLQALKYFVNYYGCVYIQHQNIQTAIVPKHQKTSRFNRFIHGFVK